MTLNPNYEAIGKAFTEQYYLMFDNPATRSVRSINFLGFSCRIQKNRKFIKFGFAFSSVKIVTTKDFPKTSKNHCKAFFLFRPAINLSLGVITTKN